MVSSEAARSCVLTTGQEMSASEDDMLHVLAGYERWRIESHVAEHTTRYGQRGNLRHSAILNF